MRANPTLITSKEKGKGETGKTQSYISTKREIRKRANRKRAGLVMIMIGLPGGGKVGNKEEEEEGKSLTTKNMLQTRTNKYYDEENFICDKNRKNCYNKEHSTIKTTSKMRFFQGNNQTHS